MACSCNNIKLLLSCEVNELNRISGYTDCEVSIFLFLRMLHGINKFLGAEYIDIEVMCTLFKISVHYADKVVNSFAVIMSECIRMNSLCIGNTVKRIFIRKLGN